MTRLGFKLEREAPDSNARAASFQTLHGEVQTPVFMPVGTQATVKSQSVDSLRKAGSRVLLANTYHLMLRPGPEVFRKFGGIHRFMNWDGPVLTDSGGYQIFSLPHSREMNEEGARFQSYVDGRSYLLSPEESIGMQRAIGSDIMMSLDQCISSTAEHAQAETAMELTHRWAQRSLVARGDSPQSLFGIVQGACYLDLRKRSADFLTQLPFDGYAIGGLAVGETKAEREDFTEATAKLLPRDLPRYLMGVGTPIDILEAVHRGVDMFDCILPSSLAQRGVAYTSHGKLQLRRSVYKFAEEPIDGSCPCDTCQNYSRAYLHHLNKCDELLGWKLLTTHNLTFYHQLMREIRGHILDGSFADYYRAKRLELVRADEDNPAAHPMRAKIPKALRGQRLGDYDITMSPKGFASIRQVSSGEIMHSVTEPKEEAQVLYVGQSRLAERLVDLSQTREPLVIWDVGLGAASNAMAAVQCFEGELAARGEKDIRALRIVSFENDLDSLKLASKHTAKFPHLRHAAPYKILENGKWEHSSGLLQWELIAGDFAGVFETAVKPDIIFYDLFSAKSNVAHWTPELFARLHKYCAKGSAALYTYSASTAVRATMLAAGFFVANGVAAGPKNHTTAAFIRAEDARAGATLLGPEWLKRWHRSDAKFPTTLPGELRVEFSKSICNHSQFQGL